MQLSEDKTYRTRDGSRTGIRVVKNAQYSDLWFERETSPAGTWTSAGRLSHYSEQLGDLIEEIPAPKPRPFAYADCPMHEDGRRRAVTRDGREVVLLSDRGPGDPIVGFKKGEQNILTWETDGTHWRGDPGGSTDLLVPPPSKRVVWVVLTERHDGRFCAQSQTYKDKAGAEAVLADKDRAYRIEID